MLNRYSILFILIALVIAVPDLSAGGRQEDRMPQALELMEERRYNEAILLLAEIMKTNPEQFSEAEKLMREIRTVRDAYNDLYSQLIEVLDPPEGENINEDRAYEIIREMESLDADPNEAAVAAFAQARDSIVFAVNNRAYINIMNTAAQQIGRLEYKEAVRTYLTGYSLHRESFEAAEYGNIITGQADILRDNIMAAAESFIGIADPVEASASSYAASAGTGNAVSVSDGYSNFEDVMLRASSYWESLKRNAAELESLRLELLAEDESDIPYLSTNRVLTVGRSVSENPEGIAGVISLIWNDAFSRVLDVVTDRLEAVFRQAVGLYEKSDFSGARTAFSDASLIAETAARILKLRGSILYMDDNLAFLDRGYTSVQEELPLILEFRIVSRLSDYYTSMSERTEEMNSIAKSVEAAVSLEPVRLSMAELDTLRSSLSAAEEDLFVMNDRQDSIGSSGFDVGTNKALLSEFSDNINTLLTLLTDRIVRAQEKILVLRTAPEEQKVAEAGEKIDDSSGFIEGVNEIINGLELPVKRPDRSVQLLSEAADLLDSADINLAAAQEGVSEIEDAVRRSDAVTERISVIAEIRSEITDKRNQIDELLSKAEELNIQADDAYSLGNLRLDEAYANYDREDYDGARNKYYDAETQFLKSLEYREDPQVRRLLSEELVKLDSDITLALNRKVINEVRQLINRGKDYYNLQEFIKAEQSFQQAQARYQVTNEGTNPEVDIWLNRVKKALEATSGRKIAITDPLYTEIISILNRVEEEFDKGKKLLSQGKEDEASVHFNEAINNIELVKEPFPRNFKASVLYLKILEFTQKDTFDSFFRTMYETALANIDEDPKSADDDLLALYEINPDFPGIKTAVYRSGVTAGRITPPPAQVDMRRATQLYNQAKAIVDADNRAQFPIALAYLEEAIQINNSYDAAAVLMDRIRTSTGSTSQVAMSSTDTQQLRYAESLYVEGRYLEANIIVNQLWENPENRKSSKLNDLKAKVEARL